MTQTQFVRRVVKPVVFLLALQPAAWLVYNAFWGDLGVNPVETITNHTGIWCLRFLVLTLAITPLRWLTGFNPLTLFRRPIGLFAFFYGVLHFMTYFVLDHSLMLDGVWEDVVKRPYITAGFTAFVLMIPLAITSTTGWIRRLGGRNWNLLHRLVYISALGGALHYFWKVKLDTTNPVYYFAIVGVLLAARLWKSVAKRRAVAPGAARAAGATVLALAVTGLTGCGGTSAADAASTAPAGSATSAEPSSAAQAGKAAELRVIQHEEPKRDFVGPQPERFRWSAIAGADHYAIGVWNETDRLMWRMDDLTASSVAWPNELVLDAGTYFWSVSGLQNGREIAKSGTAAFVLEQ